MPSVYMHKMWHVRTGSPFGSESVSGDQAHAASGRGHNATPQTERVQGHPLSSKQCINRYIVKNMHSYSTIVNTHTVTSRFTMSPSFRGLSSGIPCTMTSFTAGRHWHGYKRQTAACWPCMVHGVDVFWTQKMHELNAQAQASTCVPHGAACAMPQPRR